MNLRKSPVVPEVTSGVPRVVPIATNFDFLEGAFNRAERARRTSLGAAMGAMVVLSALTLLGVQAVVVARTDAATTEQARAQNMKVVAEIAQLDQAQGISADQLRSHASERQEALRTAVKSATDVSALISAVNASLPSGVTVKSMDFTGVSVTPPKAGSTGSGSASSSSASGSSAGSSSGSAGTAKPAAGASRSLKVVGTASDFAMIGAWARALGSVPGVTNVSPSWSGGGESLQVTLTASLSDAANSQRAKDAAASDQFGFQDGSVG